MTTRLTSTLMASLAGAGTAIADGNDERGSPPPAVPASISRGDFDGNTLEDARVVQPDGAGQPLHDVLERDDLGGARTALSRHADARAAPSPRD
jgi:hypothetical protein